MKITIYLFSGLVAVCNAITDVEQAFLDFEIVPNVFPAAPTKPINVRYHHKLTFIKTLIRFSIKSA